MPVRDRASVVGRTLESIERQTFRPLSVVIVDNGSTDITPEIVEKWRRRVDGDDFKVTVVTEPRPGASAARNRGLREVESEYVMFFDSDDEMLPRHVELAAAYLKAKPDTDILRWDTGILDPDGWLTVKSPRFHDEWMLHMMHGTLATQRWVGRTSLLRSIGGWDESLPVWNDLELGCRLIASGAVMRKLNGEPTVRIHPQAESITGTDYSSRSEGHCRALDMIESLINRDEHPERVLMVRGKRAIMAGLYRREKACDKAAAMRREALKGLRRVPRLKLRLIEKTVAVWGRGGAAMALQMLGGKAPKC